MEKGSTSVAGGIYLALCCSARFLCAGDDTRCKGSIFRNSSRNLGTKSGRKKVQYGSCVVSSSGNSYSRSPVGNCKWAFGIDMLNLSTE